MKQKIIYWEEQVRSDYIRKAVPLMTHAGIELTERKISEAVKNGDVHFEALKTLDKIFSPDAVCAVMDLTVEAEAFGCKVNFFDNEVPSVAAVSASDESGIDRLAIPGIYESRTKEYLKAIEYCAAYFSAKPVLAVCIGPFSLAGRIFGMTEIMTSLLFEPEVVLKLVEKCTTFLNLYVQEFRKLGADGVIMAEPAAGLLSSEQCDIFSSQHISTIVKDVQDDNFLFILHNCGNTGHVTASMITTGARGLHFGNRIDLLKVLREVPEEILVLGNLDPVGLFKMADPADLFRASSELLELTSSFKNYIISSGCEIPPGVSKVNYDAFFRSVHEFNAKRTPVK